MKDHLRSRLEELQAEYQKGQERLTDLEQQSVTLKNTMMRISGAIQVLEELLQENPPAFPGNDAQSDQIEPSEAV